MTYCFWKDETQSGRTYIESVFQLTHNTYTTYINYETLFDKILLNYKIVYFTEPHTKKWKFLAESGNVLYCQE